MSQIIFLLMFFYAKGNIVKDEKNRSLRKRTTYLKNILLINKMSNLGKKEKQCKHYWLREIYEKPQKLGTFYTLFHDSKEYQNVFFPIFLYDT